MIFFWVWLCGYLPKSIQTISKHLNKDEMNH